MGKQRKNDRICEKHCIREKIKNLYDATKYAFVLLRNQNPLSNRSKLMYNILGYKLSAINLVATMLKTDGYISWRVLFYKPRLEDKKGGQDILATLKTRLPV